MRMFKRIVAMVLLLCMVLPWLPLSELVQAAEVTHRYVLDTDGIDAGATYLIVNTSSVSTANALMFYYNSSSSRDFKNQQVVVEQEGNTRYIAAGFENEEDCTFQFSAATNGKITHGNYSIDLDKSRYATGTSGDTITFNHLGNGQYRLQMTYWFRTYYLRYSNDDWSGSTSTSSNTVYLYKLTEHVVGYDVKYDANGATSGTVPAGETELSPGGEHTVQQPKELRKDIGMDTWLFLCWNTKPDGSGIEYAPGDKVVVNGDLTLYADWYQQTKHMVSMMTYLDGELMDIEKIAGEEKKFFAKLENSDTYIPLERTAEGVYSNKVVDNGVYEIYSKVGDGDYEQVHGHKVTIYNQDGTTECMHYSVSYDANGGVWEGNAPADEKHHDGEQVTISATKPTLQGNRFVEWQDEKGTAYAPGKQVSIHAPLKLKAVWEELIDITVNVVIDHNVSEDAGSEGGADNAGNIHDLTISLLRQEGGVDLPVDTRVLNTGYTYENNITTYTVVFKNMPQGVYKVAATKSDYVTSFETSVAPSKDQTIDLLLQYTPENHALEFEVVVNADDGEQALMPEAVNVRVSYWGYNKAGELGWHIITQQGEGTVPSTVMIDENGRGTGMFPVWHYWSDADYAYDYRVEVTSIVLPNGTIVPVSGDHETYYVEGSGLYTATVDVINGGRVPQYPYNSDTQLPGAYFTDEEGHPQNGMPVVTVDITPMTVTFDAGNGLVNGQQKIVLENQYLYPDLNQYVAVPNAEDRVFVCWVDEQGEPVENLSGATLTGNVTYYARYNENFVLSGEVLVDATYMQDGERVHILKDDRAKEVMVVLQKKVGDTYNDVTAQLVNITYVDGADHGTGRYDFTDLPNDGTEYRVHMVKLNYTGSYNNNGDEAFAEDEAVAIINTVLAKAEVDIHLEFQPDVYMQALRIDASQIAPELRPTSALAQITFRDLGGINNFATISQHTVPPYGIQVEMNDNAIGMTEDAVWNWHTNGALYEYQAKIAKVYGNVPGAYDQNGIDYTANSPYTIVYGAPNNFLRDSLGGGEEVTATLIPKEYMIILDLNLEGDTQTSVYGLEDYMLDDGTGNERYAFIHTWSYQENFIAYPYREGYVFMGWESSDPAEVYVEEDKDNAIHVGSTLDHEVTLKAIWEPLSGTDYTVRYLELNTDKVLKQARVFKDAADGDVIMAAEKVEVIAGYAYAGAATVGKYTPKENDPFLLVTDNPAENLLVIYYLPDGSDGYTEQVESNLEINKTAVLENDGTYTITMDTFTKDNPITTQILQNTPLDIVLVLDQSGSLAENEYLKALKDAVNNFVETLANHGRVNDVDHRIAIVGYASNQSDGDTGTVKEGYSFTGGKESQTWTNTGVFDSNGEFHLYNIKGFNYTELKNTSTMTVDGEYYTKVEGEDGEDHFVLLRHHDEYRHLITEEQARIAVLQGQDVFGYVYDADGKGTFEKLERNSSGLWLYGDKKLYSDAEFFTYHTDVWTHRDGIEPREIHAYGVGAAYTPVDGHEGVYTREETASSSYQQSIYQDAMIPVSVEAGGAGGTHPGLLKATESLGANGATRAGYGMEMANAVFEANPAEEGRVRMVVMFTDGDPGYNGFDGGNRDQAVTEANNAIKQANIAQNQYGAHVYAIGLYESDGVNATSDIAYYMNALSSNYPNAQSMDDIKRSITNVQAPDDTVLETGKYYVRHNNTSSTYYELKHGTVRISGKNQTGWYYTRGNSNYMVSTASAPVVTGGKVGNFNIYYKSSGYAETTESGYYTTTESADYLKEYFENVLRDITTKITTQIILEDDTILRDIMNQGLVLTDDTVISVSLQEGNYNLDTGKIVWSEELIPLLDLDLSTGATHAVHDESGVEIFVYNLDAENATNPNGEVEYHPHTVDVTGYNYAGWYISEKHTQGYKMVVTITRIEATEDVEWRRSTNTNYGQSGLWLPANDKGERQLLLPFEQPTTIFVERAYVLDYGKTFTLKDWYFDDDIPNEKYATPIHVDCDLTNGMNGFDPEKPNTQNVVGGEYGNTSYGNVQIVDGEVTYTPTAMNWGGYDQFYVFGNTWRKTVLAQDANQNGNLWNKVTVIPANNIYYEDSFVTTESTTQNGIQGFVFSGTWTTEGTSNNNVETPEHQEGEPYGNVHGWTNALGDDYGYSDGSAHVTNELGAQAEFTFTGTGVEVYTRTNAQSGMVIGMLYRLSDENQTSTLYASQMIDNLSVSNNPEGYYYNIPTLAFKKLPYGTYTLRLIATMASTDGKDRYEYCIDGVRILNPLGNDAVYQSGVVQDAYDLETNAVFTEVRDILLDYGDFNLDMPDSDNGKLGAVFIDQIKEGQGTGNDPIGNGVVTYEIGTFKNYGPKNEVYLKSGQAIVLKVAEGNNYFVGLKSLTGEPVKANLSGIENDEPTTISLQHTADMYYKVTPVNGYIVIQNGNTEDGAILSITNLRTTNLEGPAPNGGVLNLKATEAVNMMRSFSAYMTEKQTAQARVDANGDGVVTNDDVIELMWYALFPQENTINGDGDINRDGAVTNADVVELMWYVLFPEM